jgi:protein TonB
MYYLEAGYSKHRRLRNAVLLAIALHIALLASISFESNSSAYETPQIKVTLATRPSDQAPDESRHIAQANQEGSGEEADFAEISSPNNALSSEGDPGQQALLQPQEAPNTERDALTTAAAAQRSVTSKQLEEEQLPLMGINPEVDKLTRELANLATSTIPRPQCATACTAVCACWRLYAQTAALKTSGSCPVRAMLCLMKQL